VHGPCNSSGRRRRKKRIIEKKKHKVKKKILFSLLHAIAVELADVDHFTTPFLVQSIIVTIHFVLFYCSVVLFDVCLTFVELPSNLRLIFV
jgi:hypothetical protein